MAAVFVLAAFGALVAGALVLLAARALLRAGHDLTDDEAPPAPCPFCYGTGILPEGRRP